MEKSKDITNDVTDHFTDIVEIRGIYKVSSLMKYERWTKVSRLLAYGLQGVELREIK